MSEELKETVKEIQEITGVAITLRLGKMVAYKRVGDKLETLLPKVIAHKITAGKVLEEILDFITEQMEEIELALAEQDLAEETPNE